MVWLSCSFQTVGSSYYTIAATLRTHWGGNTPSVSHVGSNQMRVLTVTISRMKMLFTSGGLCPLCCPSQLTRRGPDTEHEYWAEHWRRLQWSCRAETAATPESLLLYFHHRGGNLRRKYSYETTQGKTVVICLFMLPNWEDRFKKRAGRSSLQSCSLIL